MPNRQKRRKTQHTHPQSNEPSQAEIWDDSALLRSWNDALAEYEFYHSVHARGEDVEEVIARVERGEQTPNGDLEGESVGVDEEQIADVLARVEGGDEAVAESEVVTEQVREEGVEVGRDEADVVTVGDALENIKMAYYWAGYYSGLYDGQQRRQR